MNTLTVQDMETMKSLLQALSKMQAVLFLAVLSASVSVIRILMLLQTRFSLLQTNILLKSALILTELL
mgnify:CR=1 FL=1